ncbi:MAG: metallophosphoesterase [Prevotella sp.]|nr:metallophosphoesterase [Prevotella sp.]
MTKRKFFAVLATVALAANMTVWLTACSSVDNPVIEPTGEEKARMDAPDFDEGNIVLTFAALSDSHIMVDPETSMQDLLNKIEQMGYPLDQLSPDTRKLVSTVFRNKEYFQAALPFLASQSSKGLDALVMPGDLTNNGFQQEIDTLLKYYKNEPAINGKPFIYCSGNHDIFSEDEGAFTQKMKKAFDNTGAYDADDPDRGWGANDSRHSVVGGIHFIQVNVNNYEWSNGVYSDDVKQWLDDELRVATTENPGKPVFVLSHLAIQNTVTGSDFYAPTTPDMVWACDYIKPILDKYPQAVLLSGHTHFSMNTERSILQDRFTMINMGVIHYMITDYGYWNMNEGNSYIPEDFDRHPQGSLFEVDNNGTTRIHNYDFGLGKQMGQPLVLPAPGYRNSLTRYGWDRANKPGPILPSHDIVAQVEDGKATVTVPRASGNGSQVLYYLVNITDEVGNIVADNHKYINDLLITAQEEDMANPVTLGLGTLPAGHTYTIKVTACNVWGTQGDSLTTTVRIPEDTANE